MTVEEAHKKVMEVHKDLLQKLEDNPVYDYVRVYFNLGNNPEHAWSVDTGPGTTEYQTAFVLVTILGYTDTDLTANNVTKPRAWLHCAAARLKVGDGFIEVY